MFRKFPKRKAGENKYGAKKTVCPSKGHAHPSQLEASVCELLTQREKAGDIRNVKYIHSVELDYSIRWKVDFSFEQAPDWTLCFAEAKGKEDRDFKLKFKMWKGGCGLGPLELWKGTARRPMLVGIYYPGKKGEK